MNTTLIKMIFIFDKYYGKSSLKDSRGSWYITFQPKLWLTNIVQDYLGDAECVDGRMFVDGVLYCAKINNGYRPNIEFSILTDAECQKDNLEAMKAGSSLLPESPKRASANMLTDLYYSLRTKLL